MAIKDKKVKMSVPEGKDFNTSYTLDPSRSKYYWDTDRNLGNESNTFATDLLTITREITELLISKNKAYGNTALNPTNIFSKLSASEAICARLDDKLARISNKGIYDETEDTVDDLIGYLLLLKMALKNETL